MEKKTAGQYDERGSREGTEDGETEWKETRLKRFGPVARRGKDYVGQRAGGCRHMGKREAKRTWADFVRENIRVANVTAEDTMERNTLKLRVRTSNHK